MIYWKEFPQKPIVDVRCSLAYIVTMAFDFTNKFVTDMQEGHRPRKKITRGVPLDNIGQYQTILYNGQYHNIFKNIITAQKRES